MCQISTQIQNKFLALCLILSQKKTWEYSFFPHEDSSFYYYFFSLVLFSECPELPPKHEQASSFHLVVSPPFQLLMLRVWGPPCIFPLSLFTSYQVSALPPRCTHNRISYHPHCSYLLQATIIPVTGMVF